MSICLDNGFVTNRRQVKSSIPLTSKCVTWQVIVQCWLTSLILHELLHEGITPWKRFPLSLQRRCNGRDGVSNHQPRCYFFNRLSRRRSKKTPKLRVTGLSRGIHRSPVNSPHKWPVTRKIIPFDDVIMWWLFVGVNHRWPGGLLSSRTISAKINKQLSFRWFESP